jgi:hypothetical protein
VHDAFSSGAYETQDYIPGHRVFSIFADGQGGAVLSVAAAFSYPTVGDVTPSFAFTAQVDHVTNIKFRPLPRTVRAGRTVTLRARITTTEGVPRGTCVFERDVPGVVGFDTRRIGAVAARGGACQTRTRATTTARYTVRFRPVAGWQKSARHSHFIRAR